MAPARAAGDPETIPLDHAAAPGANYDKAEFRLWYPAAAQKLRAVVVLMPGSNDDGRPEVADAGWRAFAARHDLALVGCRYTDKPHAQSFIEQYADASHGSGQALLDALVAFAPRADHPELAAAPLLLWGMSAGGEFNYEFVAWKPERVIAFVVNKGGIYYSALLCEAARRVPGLFFVGEADLRFRNETIAGLFAVNRRAGALWALAEEPGVGHAVGRSRDLALVLFEDVLSLRLPPPASSADGSPLLQPLDERSGFLGELRAHTIARQDDTEAPDHPTAWLPTERCARAWQALATGRTFSP